MLSMQLAIFHLFQSREEFDDSNYRQVFPELNRSLMADGRDHCCQIQTNHPWIGLVRVVGDGDEEKSIEQ